MRVLVACEYSGIVRDAFIARGHEAISCDIIDTEWPGPHLIGDVRKHLRDGWDMMIAFPPCTHLCVSGADKFKYKQREQTEALEFVRELLHAPIRRIAIENPIGVISTRIRPPDQIIQPWMFGHDLTKATCLWLKGLLPLQPTNIVPKSLRRKDVIRNYSPGIDRGKRRSKMFHGIARAMAEQWNRSLFD